ncbi:MAG: SIMPL domain-containing protein [candidate division Zixibacteria bacterium]|nr:SIMPL domain-containing protein [candidate division Zixibacteria bacterium]
MKTGHVILLSASLIVAALVFGIFFYNARSSDDTINVVGMATKRFDSDIVKWRITIGRNTGLNDVSSGYLLIQNDLQFLKKLFSEKGLQEKELTIQPINTLSNYSREGQISGYNLQQGVFVITSNIAAVEDIALNPAALIDKGIILQNSNLEYFYSKLSDIKMELLAEATKDAQKRASEIARNSNVHLGNVTSLRVGVFQITEPFSTEVSDYGMYNTQTKQKDITVTVRASFKIH